MVFWVVLRSPSILRFVEPVVESLRRQGHRIEVSFDQQDDPAALSHALDGDGVTVSRLAGPARGARALTLLRAFASYVRLRRRWPPLLRDRWLEYFPHPVAGAIRTLDRLSASFVLDSPLVAGLASALARRWPVSRQVTRQLASLSPDLVLVSPGIYPDSREIDAVRAARTAGVMSVVFVLSWDNLTSKGMFHAEPDRLLVWNDEQVREAVEWHGFAKECVDVVGAPAFDYLFDDAALEPRSAVLERLGVPPGCRYVVYGVSSRLGLGLGGEVPIVERLAEAIRTMIDDPPVLVVRPHPGNDAGWDELHLPGVVVWPTLGFPANRARQRDLHNGLRHADAILGLNTSLFVDAAIVDRPAVALRLERDPNAARIPSRVVHFQQLVDAGFLELVEGPPEAAAALARILGGEDGRRVARRRFVERFVRPAGLDRPAADVAAERLASLAS